MKELKIAVAGIPAIVWGEPSEKVYIHVHGKMSRKEYAQDFAEIAEKKGYQTISFDLPEHGERADCNCRCDIWNGIHDLNAIADYVFSKWNQAALYACSLGAFFSLHAYSDRKIEKCLFQSPIVDMEYLIRQMFLWFQVTEERLRTEKEIATPVEMGLLSVCEGTSRLQLEYSYCYSLRGKGYYAVSRCDAEIRTAILV